VRILHVTDFFPPVRGGLEGHVDDLAGAQVERGHDVHVVTMTPTPSSSHAGVVLHVVRTVSGRVIPYEDPSRPFHPPIPDPMARRTLRQVLDDVRPDIIHAHTWLGVSLPRRRRVPLVLTAHDYALICQLHTLHRTTDEACDGPSFAMCVRCARRRDGLARATLMTPATVAGRRLLRPDAVITLSQHVADVLRPYVSAPIDVCGGLLPTAVTSEATPRGLPTTPFVLFAGDPARHKGIDVLLEAWRHPRLTDVALVVAATRPVELDQRNVTVVHLDRAQMPAAWRAATIAVVPSRWAEPFGMSAMEALAAGTPVVASDVGALGEVVRDGIDGVLVPPDDVPALAAAVRGLLDDEERRRRFADAARSGAARFLPTAVAARIDLVYERVVGAATAPVG
jgi:glycosyltransferase involved in cell wall biosynthesis